MSTKHVSVEAEARELMVRAGCQCAASLSSGDLVEIAGNAKVKKATTTGEAFGIVTIGLHDARNQGIVLSPDSHSRVNVIPFEFQQCVVRCTAAEILDAGDRVVLDTTTAGKVKKAGAGVKGFGKVWVGGGANSTIEVLV